MNFGNTRTEFMWKGRTDSKWENWLMDIMTSQNLDACEDGTELSCIWCMQRWSIDNAGFQIKLTEPLEMCLATFGFLRDGTVTLVWIH